MGNKGGKSESSRGTGKFGSYGKDKYLGKKSFEELCRLAKLYNAPLELLVLIRQKFMIHRSKTNQIDMYNYTVIYRELINPLASDTEIYKSFNSFDRKRKRYLTLEELLHAVILQKQACCRCDWSQIPINFIECEAPPPPPPPMICEPPPMMCEPPPMICEPPPMMCEPPPVPCECQIPPPMICNHQPQPIYDPPPPVYDTTMCQHNQCQMTQPTCAVPCSVSCASQIPPGTILRKLPRKKSKCCRSKSCIPRAPSVGCMHMYPTPLPQPCGMTHSMTSIDYESAPVVPPRRIIGSRSKSVFIPNRLVRSNSITKFRRESDSDYKTYSDFESVYQRPKKMRKVRVYVPRNYSKKTLPRQPRKRMVKFI